MAGKYTGLQKAYAIENEEIPMYTGVTYGSKDGFVAIPEADNAVPLGVVDNDERINDPMRAGGNQYGRNIAVHLEGIAEIKLSGTVGYGERVILGAGGVAKALPKTSGTYNVLGFAEKAGTDGDVIPVRLATHVITVA